MTLAIFDLDNTLIAHDSDYLWGEYMIQLGIVDEQPFRSRHKQFDQQYLAGHLDIFAYLDFSLEPLTRYSMKQLHQWRQEFMAESITPVMLRKGFAQIHRHRQQNHHIMIITASNRFITEPIAEAFNVDTLLAIEPEIINDRYTGKITGQPTFRTGKVIRLQQWLNNNSGHSLKDSYFYSDSHNDLPLLEQVGNPVAVDPDPRLKQIARERIWPEISLR